jgi:multiple sugar transport system substrate-binding protein
MALTLAACAGGSSEVEVDPEDLRGSTIKVLVSSGHQQFTPLWDRLDEFEDETGIKVELDEVGTVDIEGTFLRDMTLGGCTYDNVEILDGAMAVSAEHLADLGPFLEAEGSSTDELLSGQAGWTGNAMTFDGKLKYYPFYSGAKGIAYRTDLFEDPENQAAFEEQFGYELPLPPTNPDELRDLAEFFTKDGMHGIVFSGVGDPLETTLADLIFRSGVGGYQDEEGNSLWGPEHPENQEAVVNAAEWLTGLVEDGFAPQDVLSMQTGEATSYYTGGGAAMIYDHIYLPWAQITADNVTSEIGESGSFEPPSFVEGAGGITFYWGRAIPECSENKAASWEFMKWVMSEENLKSSLTEGTGVFVPTDLALLDWSVQEGILPEGVADAVANSPGYQTTIATGRIRQAVNLPLVERLLQGELSPSEYAEESGQAIQEEAAAFGLVEEE